MSFDRTDDDTWDITTGVGVTAVISAAARAVETAQPDPLIRDPLADLLVTQAGADLSRWKALAESTAIDDADTADDEIAATLGHILSYTAVRTYFFDTYMGNAVADGIRQFVILAAGLDSRAYRLDMPPASIIFEIDQPLVLDYKTTTLARAGAIPTADRRTVPIDLRQDWPSALRDAGFDPRTQTGWLAEGLLTYLLVEAQNNLFARIGGLSPAGSRIAADASPPLGSQRRRQTRNRLSNIASAIGLSHAVDTRELIYRDENRPPLTEWLDTHGWRATSRNALDELCLHDRRIDDIPFATDGAAHPDFVTAVRL